MFRNALLALMFAWMSPSVAGTVIEVSRYNLRNNARDSTLTLRTQDGKLRIDQTDEEGRETTLLFTGDQILDVDWANHTYAVIDRGRIAAARRAADPTATLRAELLAEVPPSRRLHSQRLMSAPPELIVRDADRDIQLRQTPRYKIAARVGERCQVH